MLKPVRIGFGGFMGAFYASLVPTTPALQQFTTRGLKKSILWAPARMVDAAEEMLSAWQKNDTDSATTAPPEMPVILVAMAKDYMPTGWGCLNAGHWVSKEDRAIHDEQRYDDA